MDLLFFKLALTPFLVAGLTLAGRRWGPAVSGALAGLPLTSGPVSLFLALEQGKDFAANSALGTLAGLIAVAAFSLAYARVSSAFKWIGSFSVGTVAFLASAMLLSFISPALLAIFVAVIGCLVLVLWLLPQSNDSSPTARPRMTFPGWDLPLRIVVATSLVFLLTALAPHLGPHWTGLLSPFPVFGSVLAIFAHRTFGPANAQRVLKGVVLGSFAFAVFFLIVGGLLVHLGCATTYSLAAICALVVNAFIFARLRRKV